MRCRRNGPKNPAFACVTLALGDFTGGGLFGVFFFDGGLNGAVSTASSRASRFFAASAARALAARSGLAGAAAGAAAAAKEASSFDEKRPMREERTTKVQLKKSTRAQTRAAHGWCAPQRLSHSEHVHTGRRTRTPRGGWGLQRNSRVGVCSSALFMQLLRDVAKGVARFWDVLAKWGAVVAVRPGLIASPDTGAKQCLHRVLDEVRV